MYCFIAVKALPLYTCALSVLGSNYRTNELAVTGGSTPTINRMKYIIIDTYSNSLVAITDGFFVAGYVIVALYVCVCQYSSVATYIVDDPLPKPTIT